MSVRQDRTLFALKDGVFQFAVKGFKRRTVTIVPAAGLNRPGGMKSLSAG